MEEYKTTISLKTCDVDVILKGKYIPLSVCNEHDGHCEYEGDEIEDMSVWVEYEKINKNWIYAPSCLPKKFTREKEITSIVDDAILSKLEREFCSHLKTHGR